MSVLVLNAGKKLYRGSSDNYGQPFSENRRAVYFANSRNTAEIYSGYVTEYTLKNDVQLLNMGSAEAVEWLIEIAGSDRLKRVIKKAFRIANNRNVRRHSRMKYDAYVAEFICRLGLDGYYAPRLRTKYQQGYFASEIVLCKPSKNIRVTTTFTPTRSPNQRRGRNGININNMNYTVV
jgi:hypothetical protein